MPAARSRRCALVICLIAFVGVFGLAPRAMAATSHRCAGTVRHGHCVRTARAHLVRAKGKHKGTTAGTTKSTGTTAVPAPTTTTSAAPTTTTPASPGTTTTSPSATTSTTTASSGSTGPDAFGSQITGIAAGGSIQNETPSQLAADLNLDQSAGSKWLRIDINWAQIQAGGPSSYNWSDIDAVVQGAESRGMSVLGLILYTPAWARPAGTNPTYAPDPTQYAAFAAQAVAHYSAMGVSDYEIWNEPNNAAFWTPAPNAAAYTTMLKDADASIKAVDASATVITGGLSPAANDGTNIAPVTFLQDIYADGGQGSFDAVGMHPYCNPDLPGAPDAWSAWYQMYGTPTSLRSVMVANGDGAKKIWGTEFGAPSSGISGVSPAFQASTVTIAYQLWSTYSWAGPLFFYQGRDEGTDATNLYDNYGFANVDFSLKPAFYAYQSAAAAL